ncbi:MAG: site-2 protease family protein [Nitrospira sp.]|nr:site-2 protease family protein [Nitrospira sp.]
MDRLSLSWRIGQVRGIPVHLHVSWFLVFAFVSWSLATDFLPGHLPGLSLGRYWAMGGAAAALLFLSVFLHELGHCYVAQWYQIPIDRITLFVFGGVAHMRKEAPSPRAEALIAMAGPMVSFGLGGACLGSTFLLESLGAASSWHGLMVLGTLLGVVNIQIGLFNLLPGLPLDGGRVLRAGLWKWGQNFHQATKQAAWAGLGFGALFGLVGLMVFLGAMTGRLPASASSGGGWAMLIGTFLYAAAMVSRRQATLYHMLTTVPVRELMVRTVRVLSPASSLDEAVNGHFQVYGHGGFPVVDNGQLVGLVTVHDIQAVPPFLWSRRQVQEVMRPATASLCVGPEAPIMQAMAQMAQGGWDRLVVMHDHHMIGLVTRSVIMRFLQRGEGPKPGDPAARGNGGFY